jgi:hypothetical protein
MILQTNCQLPPGSVIFISFPYGLYDFENQILKPHIKFNEKDLKYASNLKTIHKDLLQGRENNKPFDDILFFQSSLGSGDRSSLGLYGFEHNVIVIQLGYDFGVEAFDTLEIILNNINNPNTTGSLVNFSFSAYFGSSLIFDRHNFGDIHLYQNQSSGTSLQLSQVTVFPKNRNSVANYEFFFEIVSGIFESTKLVIIFDNNFSNLINGTRTC